MNVDAWRGLSEQEQDDNDRAATPELRRAARALLGSLLRPHRAPLAVASVLVVVQTLSQLAIPFLVGYGIDHGVRPLSGGVPDLRVLAGVGVLLVVMVLTTSLAQFGFLTISGRVGQEVLYELRRRLFRHFQDLSLSFYERYTSGRVIARVTSDVDAISELMQTGLNTLTLAALTVVFIGALLVVMDLRLGLLTLASFPFILWLTRWFAVESRRAYRAVRTAIALLIVHYTESLRGIRAVHAFRREPRNQEIFEDLNLRYRDANIRSAVLATTYGPSLDAIGRVTTAVVVLTGAVMVAQHSLTVGVLTAFLLYLRQFFDPMQDLSQFYNVFQASGAALEKLAGVFAEVPSVPEPRAPRIPPALRGAVALDHVTFAYRETPVLRDVTVTIPAGQTVALVGETGAGKSTIARLLARFYDPTWGSVRLDGVDLREISAEVLHQNVVMITQENFLFSGSVADNIAFGRPSATRAEIEAAAAAVGADAFIRSMPEGYDTDVRRRGARLSAGQRQLVAFARAFLAGPRVLILDEATSSLDLPSERLVQRALRTLLEDRTAIIIAHRLSTVEIADRVLVVDAGTVVEDGTPAELLARTGTYSEMHAAWLESLA
ncbi:MAG: ABC transporter ATP-binding protein [Candidatus Dormibacteria bacterium]